jgi:hypothetical protein
MDQHVRERFTRAMTQAAELWSAPKRKQRTWSAATAAAPDLTKNMLQDPRTDAPAYAGASTYCAPKVFGRAC